LFTPQTRCDLLLSTILITIVIILLFIVPHVVIIIIVTITIVIVVTAFITGIQFTALVKQIEVKSAQQILQVCLHLVKLVIQITYLVFELLLELLEYVVELRMDIIQLCQRILHDQTLHIFFCDLVAQPISCSDIVQPVGLLQSLLIQVLFLDHRVQVNLIQHFLD